MSAKSPDVVDGMLDESLLGVLLILLVVLLSTGYVYLQQLQPGGNARDGAAATAARNAQNGRRGAAAAPAGASTLVNAVSTANLSERQLKLHYSLPVRHGARTLTVSADALLDRSQLEALAWKSEGAAALLADLAGVADVYVLCALSVADEEKQKAEMDKVRAFVSTSVELKGAVKPHKVLFCATSVGEIAFVRQLEPQVHIEVDAGVVRELEKHVPRIVHVTSGETIAPSIPNVIHVTDSFESYFALLGAK